MAQKKSIQFINKGKALLQEHKEIIRKYYDFNEEEKTATATLRYDSPDDIVDDVVGSKRYLFLNEDTASRINTIIDNVPEEYDVVLHFEFRDIKDYTEDEIKTIVKNNIKMECYRTEREMRRKQRFGVFFTASGILAVVISVFIMALWPESFPTIYKDIVSFIMDILASVQIWEACSIFFIEGSEVRAHNALIRRKLVGINVSKQKD